MDDQTLTEFIQRTKADPSLAQDLLEATEWNLEAAIAAYEGLNVTFVEKKNYENDSDDFVDLSVIHENYDRSRDSTPDDTDTMVLKRRGKGTKAKSKGLTHVADKVGDVFWNVAVSQTKLTIGAAEKQNVFDEQFFRHSFLYPDITGESQEIQDFIAEDIIEISHKSVLEKSNRLNWWSSTGKLPRLEPLGTSGDGNCLLHAVSLYMWGLPDRDLILRTHLHRILTTGREKEGIQRRWRQVTTARNQEAGGLVFSEEEWDFEWHEIVRIATNQPRRHPTTDSLRRYSTLRVNYESLEEIHVYAIAQVIRRPIIVIANQFIRDMNDEPLAPIYFGGIYLPLECSATSCYKSPLVLAYDSSHFSPLVAKQEPKLSQKSNNSRLRRLASKQDSVIPLVDPEGVLLPLMFLYDPDAKTDIHKEWSKQNFTPNEIPDGIRSLLESYFDVRWIQLSIGSKFESAKKTPGDKSGFHIPVKVPQVRFPAAVVSCGQEHEYQSLLVVEYLKNAKERYEVEKLRREKVAAERARQEEEYRRIQINRPVPCVGENCDMFGTQATNNLCSICFSRYNSAQSSEATDEDCPPEPESRSRTESDFGTESRTISEVDRRGDESEKWEIVLPDLPPTSDKGQWQGTASVVRKEDLASPQESKPDSEPKQLDPKPKKELHKTDPEPKKELHQTDPKPKKELHQTDPKPKKELHKTDPEPKKELHQTDPKPKKELHQTDPKPKKELHQTDPKPKKADPEPKKGSPSRPATTSTTTSSDVTTSSVHTTAPDTTGATNTSSDGSTASSSATKPQVVSKKPTPTGVTSVDSPSHQTEDKQPETASSKTKFSSFAKLKSRFESKPKPQPSRGYSRDLIKPITVGKDASTNASSQRVTCKSEGCEFFGSADREGYCSQCYSNK